MSAAAERPALLAALVDARLPALDLEGWRLLLSQARRCKLGGRLAVLAQARGWLAQLHPGVQQHFANVLKAIERQHLDTRWEADRLLEALRALQTPVVLLKGAAYVVAGLPAARGREFSDVDLLVPRARLRDVEMALLAHGWARERLDPYDERYYRDWMHELPPLQHVERLTHLDVHHTLTPPTSRFAIDIEPVWAACEPVAGQPGLFVLGPADRVLHSAAHLMQEGDFSGGLRDLVDLADLIGHEAERNAVFWPTLVARARQLRLAVPLHDAVVLARELLGLPVPADALQDLAMAAGAGPRRRLVVAWLRRAMLRPLQSRPEVAGALAAHLLYVRSHWLRMPWYRLAPHLLRKAWRRTLARFQRPAPELPQPGPAH